MLNNKTSVDLISGKVLLHKHRELYDVLEGDSGELWNAIDIDPAVSGVINLGSKRIYQGFIINYILKTGDNIQSGDIHLIHNSYTLSEPYHEFYYAGVETDIVFTTNFNLNEVELNITNNELVFVTFKYRILEKVLKI